MKLKEIKQSIGEKEINSLNNKQDKDKADLFELDVKNDAKKKENSNLNNCYQTIDMHTKGDRVIFISDSETLKIFRDDIYNKLKYSTISFSFLLLLQLFGHSYISYYNLIDCENKINRVHESYTKRDISKDITYICASYVMHIFLMIGYFIIAFVTTYKQSKICFHVFEIYLMIMFISDLFFSFLNP